MVAINTSRHSTAFTVSIDFARWRHRHFGRGTRVLCGRSPMAMQAADFARPGHIFPLIAHVGGVLMRSGHSEAAVDLGRLARLPTVGVFCELVNDDGTVMRGAQVAGFAPPAS